MNRALGIALAAVVWLAPGLARAEVQRFAVLIGNNTGAADEATLRFAERDATRMGTTLRDLARVPAENSVLLLDEDVAAVRRALINTNERIRRQTDDETLLIVYYSGHGDAEALHLGTSRLELDELRALVGGSSAGLRLLVVDSCRSGVVTVRKGGHQVQAFEIALEPRLTSEGAVFLSSSSATEDSQESSELQSSLFTHFLISGLLGAADANGDGRVDLSEAYRYSYENTLRASSRTLAGPQHPTFLHDLEGEGDFALTMPGARDPRRGAVVFPVDRAFLITQRGARGTVVAEVGLHDTQRRLSLRAGEYYVVARASDHLLEGPVQVGAGAEVALDLSAFERVEYAQLVRRGGTDVDRTFGVMAGYRMRTSIHEGGSLCYGATAGAVADYAAFSLGARLGFCRGGFENETLEATADDFSLSVRATHGWDFGDLTLEAGVEVGGSILGETFETRGVAPARWSSAGRAGVVLGASWQLPGGYSILIDSGSETYFLRVANDDGTGDRWAARFAWPLTAAIARRW